jgi:NADPH:quinone reductase-like Zn-dependent oxidoreductase
MKAIVLSAYGDSSHLKLTEISEPKPAAGEIKVKVTAAGLNPIDWKLRSGDYKAFMPIEFPFVPGVDVSGQVVELGPGVTQFKVDDRVIGFVKRGYAEFVTAPVEAWARIPKGMSLEDASVIPLAALTGVQLVEEVANVQGGQTVLVTGAVGAVGRAAVYAAKARGVRVIAGVRQQQRAEAETLGAAAVVALDVDAELANLPMLDAVADTVGGSTLAKLLGKVRNGGVVASTVGPPPGDKQRDVIGKGMQTHMDSKRLASLAEAVKADKFRLPIAKRFPLAEAASAQRLAEAGAISKVLLKV